MVVHGDAEEEDADADVDPLTLPILFPFELMLLLLLLLLLSSWLSDGRSNALANNEEEVEEDRDREVCPFSFMVLSRFF